MESIFIIAVIVIIAIILFIVIKDQNNSAIEKQKEHEKKIAEIRDEKQSKRDARINEYGEKPIMSSNSINDTCYYEIYQQAQKIFIHHVTPEYLLCFSDIREVSLHEGDSVINSTTSGKINTDTGSMIGRAIVGGALLGTAGEIIGASTASKSTSSQTRTKVTKRYKLVISTNSFENPTIILTDSFSSFDYLSKLYSVLQLAIEQTGK